MRISLYKKIVTIVSAVLLIGAIVINIIGLTTAVNFQKAQLIVNIVACAYAIGYVAFGFRKEGALLYKLFLGFIALKEGFALINMGVYETITQWYAYALELVSFTCPLVLLLRQDLGKRNSIIVIGTYIFVALLSLIAAVIIVPVSTPDGAALTIYNATRIILGALVLAFIIAKYIDKLTRNSK